MDLQKTKAHAHPSLGSLIVFKLIYSSYSNNPALVSPGLGFKSECQGERAVEFRMVAVEIELRLEEEDVFANKRGIS
jgi:hypothetical protein